MKTAAESGGIPSTPSAPDGSLNSWVLERTMPETATDQQKIQNIYTPGFNNDWTSKWEWETAVDAYNKGTTTTFQNSILNAGHVNAP